MRKNQNYKTSLTLYSQNSWLQSWRKLFREFLIILAAFVALCAPASSYSKYEYLVSNIHVEKTGKNSKIAKDAAIAAARTRSADYLLHYLRPYLDYSPNLAKARRYATSYSISHEIITNEAYIADLHFTFDPKGINSILEGMNSLSTEEFNTKILLVPYMKNNKNGKLEIWENDWYNSWRENKLGSLSIPELNIANVLALRDISNPNKIQKILSIHSKHEIIFAIATILSDELKVYVIRPMFHQQKSITVKITDEGIKSAMTDAINTLESQGILTNCDSNNVSIAQIPEPISISFISEPAWLYATSVLNKQDYTIQYIGDNLLVISLTSNIEFTKLLQKMILHNFVIKKIQAQDWSIS